MLSYLVVVLNNEHTSSAPHIGTAVSHLLAWNIHGHVTLHRHPFTLDFYPLLLLTVWLSCRKCGARQSYENVPDPGEAMLIPTCIVVLKTRRENQKESQLVGPDPVVMSGSGIPSIWPPSCGPRWQLQLQPEGRGKERRLSPPPQTVWTLPIPRPLTSHAQTLVTGSGGRGNASLFRMVGRPARKQRVMMTEEGKRRQWENRHREGVAPGGTEVGLRKMQGPGSKTARPKVPGATVTLKGSTWPPVY